MARRASVHGPAGSLDCRVHGSGPPVLVLHPHPLYGGTKGTRLVYRISQVLAEAGREAWRFDFRGVGGSDGRYGQGVGEVEDALAVWDAASREQPASVVGFSFGGAVAAHVAARRPVARLVLVATPAHVRDARIRTQDALAQVRCPTTLVWGTEDQQVGRSHFDALVTAMPKASTVILEGADHFLTPSFHAEALAAIVEALVPG